MVARSDKFVRRQVSLCAQIRADHSLGEGFQILEIDRVVILLALHGVQPVATVTELDDILPIASPHSPVVHDADILQQLDQPSLHVSGICGFDCGVDDALAPAHRVEEELGGSQACVEAVGDEASCIRGFV